MRRLRTVGTRRRATVVLATIGVLGATACLPIPDEVTAAACGAVVDVNDPLTWPPGWWGPIEDGQLPTALQTAQSVQSLGDTAIWTRIASIRLVPSDTGAKTEVGVIGGVTDMTAVLQILAIHPENLIVVDASEATAVANEIVALLRTDRLLPIQSSVTLSTPRHVRVSLPGSSKGAEVGRTILDRYPDLVTVDVGRKQLESDGEGGTTACLTDIPRWIFANAVPDGITASVVLDHQSVASGSDITGAIVITNNRREPVPVWGNEPIICETRPNQPITSLDTQYVVNQDLAGVDHGKRVVMDGSGWSAWEGNGGAVAELWSFDELSTEGGWPCAYTSGFSATIQRGGTVSIPFRANTLSMQPGTDVTLPAGDYLVRPQAWIFPFYLVDIPPVRVTVTAAP